jgi:hypothetical protein
MTKTDRQLFLALLLIGMLLFVCSKFFFYQPNTQSRMVIKVSGEIVKTIILHEGSPLERYNIEGKKGQAIVETKGLKVRMLEAPCPDQICVNQGWIDSPRQTIVCVPNEIVIYLDEEASVDAITG